MDGFREGYEYFEKSAGIVNGSFSGSAYIARVEKEIESLNKDINAMKGFQTAVDKLKGDAAEFWHSGTFNIDAALKGSKNRTFVDRSHDFASADISSNFGSKFGLKYYSDGPASAKQQAKSLFERYKEYQQAGGKDTLEQFMANRNFDPTDVSAFNNPIYAEQFRLIPADQLKEAQTYLAKKIGITALSSSAEGFVRGSIAAAITTACKAGKLGIAMKSIDPSLIGVGTSLKLS